SNNINTMDNGGALKAPPKREYIAYKDKSDAEYESDNDTDTDTESDTDIDTEYESEDDYKDDTDNDYNDEYEYNGGLMNPFEPYEPQYKMPQDREFDSLMEDDNPFSSTLLNPTEPMTPKNYRGTTHERTPSLDRKKTLPVYYNRPARS